MIITRIRNTFIGIGLFILAVFLISLAYDSTFIVQRQVNINAPADSVFTFINTPTQWDKWMSWQKPDSSYSFKYTGPAQGTGAAKIMKGPLIDITFKIAQSKPNEGIRYEITTADGEFSTDGDFILSSKGNQTTVMWVDSGDVGYNSFARFSLKSITEKQGKDMENSLARLKKAVEAPGE